MDSLLSWLEFAIGVWCSNAAHFVSSFPFVRAWLLAVGFWVEIEKLVWLRGFCATCGSKLHVYFYYFHLYGMPP